jgi:hypothetical protein
MLTDIRQVAAPLHSRKVCGFEIIMIRASEKAPTAMADSALNQARPATKNTRDLIPSHQRDDGEHRAYTLAEGAPR